VVVTADSSPGYFDIGREGLANTARVGLVHPWVVRLDRDTFICAFLTFLAFL
jgi:hypothetical protein